MLQDVHIPRSYSVWFWIFLIVIGVTTGCIAFLTSVTVSFALETLTSQVVSDIVNDSDLEIKKLLLYVFVNLVAVLLSATLVLFVSPLAAGSGIPNMYAYLNGVDMPDFLHVRVALAKIPGSILAVTGGLCIGKEGPMLHIGSIIATWLGNTELFKMLRGSREQDPLVNDRHTRELVACGVAAGLATGFSAPVGGLLFALEMSTRWRSELTARTLFACAVVSLATQAAKDLANKSDLFNYGSLLFFKDTLNFPTPYAEIPFMATLGALGGFVGCMYTTLNIQLGVKRRPYLKNRYFRYGELILIGLLTTGLRLVLPLLGKCRPCICDDPKDPNCTECSIPGAPELNGFALYGCPEERTFNDLGVFMFNPQGYLIKALFRTEETNFSGWSLFVLFLFYYGLSIITYGAAIPAGLFTPSLITGGSLGQLFAFVMNCIIEACGFDFRLNNGFYALLGAASVLGGLFRFSVSFSVILAELTGAEKQLPFLMLVLIIAKGVGDRFNQNILNHLCMLLRLPYIGGHPESVIRRQGLTAGDIGDHDFPILFLEEESSKLRAVLEHPKYKAFPVILSKNEPNYVGMITVDGIREALPPERMEQSSSNGRTIWLDPYLSRPLTVSYNMSLSALHRLFISSGLEYIPVMDSYGPLNGIITRYQLLETQKRYVRRKIRERVFSLKPRPDEETFLEES